MLSNNALVASSAWTIDVNCACPFSAITTPVIDHYLYSDALLTTPNTITSLGDDVFKTQCQGCTFTYLAVDFTDVITVTKNSVSPYDLNLLIDNTGLVHKVHYIITIRATDTSVPARIH